LQLAGWSIILLICGGACVPVVSSYDTADVEWQAGSGHNLTLVSLSAEFCENCIEMAKATSDTVGLAQARAQLARLQAEQDEIKGAEAMLKEALEELVAALGKDHAVVGRCYQTWGLAALRANKMVDARQHLEQALKIQVPLVFLPLDVDMPQACACAC
jgi:hypothetical protein